MYGLNVSLLLIHLQQQPSPPGKVIPAAHSFLLANEENSFSVCYCCTISCVGIGHDIPSTRYNYTFRPLVVRLPCLGISRSNLFSLWRHHSPCLIMLQNSQDHYAIAKGHLFNISGCDNNSRGRTPLICFLMLVILTPTHALWLVQMQISTSILVLRTSALHCCFVNMKIVW